MRKAGQSGARAQARVQSVKKRNVKVVMPRRPNCSLRGAQRIGPKVGGLVRTTKMHGGNTGDYQRCTLESG